MKLLKILPIIFLLLIFQSKTFAETPEISYGSSYFDMAKGYYVLKDNVRVALNNHGLKAIVTADEARVNVFKKKCWAKGSVNFSHDNVNFGCNEAFLQWEARTANVIGAVKFDSLEKVSITSGSATFNWREKIADFYENVQIKPKTEILNESGEELDQWTNYSHVRYDVQENKILQLEKNSEMPEIIIPDSDA